MHKHQSIYSKLYVKYSKRARFTPRVARPFRPHVIAWHGPDAFFRNRFYELDTWYKARIQRPEILPQLQVIDPDLFYESYEQRMAIPKMPSMDIGFKTKEKQWKTSPEEKSKFESLAIKNQLLINLENCDSTNQLSLINHFNIFEDLFMPGVYFFNTQPFQISWDQVNKGREQGTSSSFNNITYFGNVIKASDAAKTPMVEIGKLGSDGFNTLLMLNLEGPGQYHPDSDHQVYGSSFEPDACQTTTATSRLLAASNLSHEQLVMGRLEQNQLLHWMVPNIPDDHDRSSIANLHALTMVPYLPPVPFMGTGYNRFVFILLRHRQPIDFAEFTLKSDYNSLLARSFNMHKFYKRYENQFTPSALRFSLIQWDPSCDQTLHNLGHKSPRYWYDWDEKLKSEQKEFPMKPMPFNHYLDMFRNPETVRRDIQKERLEMLMKLKPGDSESLTLTPSKYPDIFYKEHKHKMGSFEHEQLMEKNIGKGIYTALYHPYENPAQQHQMPKYRLEKVKKAEEWSQKEDVDKGKKLHDEDENKAGIKKSKIKKRKIKK